LELSVDFNGFVPADNRRWCGFFAKLDPLGKYRPNDDRENDQKRKKK